MDKTQILEKFNYFEKKINNAKNNSNAIIDIKSELKLFTDLLSVEDKKQYADLVKKSLKEKISDANSTLQNLTKHNQREGIITYHGKKYDLREWMPISTYVAIHNLSSTNLVSMWIINGKIPPSNVLIIPELNNMKLIKNVKVN